jgi:HD-like signal output (HDOD) protein
MTKFKQSVRDIMAQVFGRADIQHLLEDRWELDEEFPDHHKAPDAFRNAANKKKQQAQEARHTRPMQRPAPTPGITRKRPPPPLDLSRLPETDPGEGSSVDSVSVDVPSWSATGPSAEARSGAEAGGLPAAARRDDAGEPKAATPARRARETGGGSGVGGFSAVADGARPRPEPAPKSPAAGAPGGTRSGRSRRRPARVTAGRPHAHEADSLFSAAGFAALDAPYPHDALDDDEDGPPRHSTLSLPSSEGEGSPEAPPVLDSAIGDEIPLTDQLLTDADASAPRDPRVPPLARATLRLEPAMLARKPDGAGEPAPGQAPLPKPLSRGKAPPGPAPSTIWDEAVIRREIAADLDALAAAGSEDREILRALRDTMSRGPVELPPLTPAAGKLLPKDGSAPSDEEVLQIVRSDPGLAGQVMKVANSPFYMAAAPAASLNAALVRIGVEQTRRAALAAAVTSSYELRGFSATMNQLREHALATAMAAEMLAGAAGCDASEAFLAGLLHDAGEMLAWRIVRQAMDRARRDGDAWTPDRPSLRRLAARQHQRLGALFLGAWDLAAGIASCLAFHHQPEAAEERFRGLVRLVHVADLVADIAVEHGRSAKWKEALGARREATSAQDLAEASARDGVDALPLEQWVPRLAASVDGNLLRGVLRSVLLRLDSSGAGSFDGPDVSTTSPP